VTFGGESSIVEVALSDQGEQTLLKRTHSVPLELAGSTAGALYVGPGWDGALLGIALYLAGQASGDPVAAANSRAVQDFNVSSIKEWSAAIEASGTADADAISAAQQASLAQYAPDLPPPGKPMCPWRRWLPRAAWPRRSSQPTTSTRETMSRLRVVLEVG
jgi:hypothetical protein